MSVQATKPVRGKEKTELVRRAGLVAWVCLVIVYFVLKRRTSYCDLGGDYFDKQNVEQKSKRLIRQLEALGLTVTVEKRAAA